MIRDPAPAMEVTGAERTAVETALRRRDLSSRQRERLEMVKAAALGQDLAAIARWSGRPPETVRRSALKARTRAANQLRALLVTAPEELRAQLRSLSTTKSALQNLLMSRWYAQHHEQKISERRTVGDHRTAVAQRAAQAQGWQATHRRPRSPHGDRFRLEEWHPLGDAPQGDGLRGRVRRAGGACATGKRRVCGKSCIGRSWTVLARPTA